MLMQTGQEPGQIQRKVLLNLKCLFWCLHELQQQYNLNLVLHSLERRAIHPDIVNSHLGDNLEYLLGTLESEDIEALQSALRHMADSRSMMEIEGKHFEIGHYVQAVDDFGPIAEGSYGVISSITPQIRGLFLLDGNRLMESTFAPSNARVIFGTYII